MLSFLLFALLWIFANLSGSFEARDCPLSIEQGEDSDTKRTAEPSLAKAVPCCMETLHLGSSKDTGWHTVRQGRLIIRQYSNPAIVRHKDKSIPGRTTALSDAAPSQ